LKVTNLPLQTSLELSALMRQPKVSECIANNKNTFYDLLSCHGDKVTGPTKVVPKLFSKPQSEN
jgi:hypothetical protein